MPKSPSNLFVFAAIVTTAVVAAFAPSGQRSGGEIGGTILYVDDDAPANGDGLTWKRAFRYLQDGLDIARQPGANVTEIRVAGGVYRPDQGANVAPGDVQASFEMVSGVALRGGYAGHYAADPTALTPTGTDDPNTQDFEKFETILSADLLGNDGPAGTFTNYEDNSFHVMTLLDPGPLTILDGLTFTASNADFRPSLAAFGGGLHCDGGSLTMTHCVFRLNEAYSGGGLYSNDTDLTITHSVFERNRAVGLEWRGGGAQLEGGNVVIEDTIFGTNLSVIGDAGGLYAVGNSTLVKRCSFLYNAAERGGGAALGPNSTAIDCSFIGNNAADSGGALWGGIHRINCTFIGNYAGQFAGGLLGSGVSIGCTFQENATGFQGGGGFAGGGTFVNCRFLRNWCAEGFPANGGAAGWVRSTGGASFSNCLFTGNDSEGAGGAVFVNAGLSASFSACTFVNNMTATGVAGAIAGQGTITDSVLWNNTPAALAGDLTISFSCIDGGWPGVGNISNDPRFANALGADGIPGTTDDNLHLLSGSPCIDSGDNTALPPDAHDLDADGNVTELLPLDLDQELRIVNDPCTRNTGQPASAGAIVDMGAFEFADFKPLPGDANGDGLVDVDDLIAVILSWGECPVPPAACPADVDTDGEVNVSDLILVILNWS